jgi:hypothetical protein
VTAAVKGRQLRDGNGRPHYSFNRLNTGSGIIRITHRMNRQYPGV